MRLQISLEVIAYVSIAGISLLYSVSSVSAYYLRANQSLGYYGYSELAESINTAIMGNYSSAEIYIPAGMCGLPQNGSSLDTRYGVFSLVEDVRISSNLTCSPGMQKVGIEYGQGYAEIV